MRLENVLKISLQDVLKTSSKRFEVVLKMSRRQFLRRLEDVLMVSWRRLGKTSWRYLEDVLKTSSKCLEDVLKMSWQDVLKTSWKRLEHVLKTYGQDQYIGLNQDVLKTSSEDVTLRWAYSCWSRRFQDAFKTSSKDKDERRLQDVFIKTNVCWECFIS